MTILQTFDPEMFFEEIFKEANKKYVERSQAHKAPVDMQAVNIIKKHLTVGKIIQRLEKKYGYTSTWPP